MQNIPPNSVIVIDNTPYHNIQLNPAPNSNSLKGDMVKRKKYYFYRYNSEPRVV